jgi:hypothetical protein
MLLGLWWVGIYPDFEDFSNSKSIAAQAGLTV